MKTTKSKWLLSLGIISGGLLIVATALTAWAQTTPGLTIAPAGTNQLLLTITNAVTDVGSYEVWTTPVLGDEIDYPWIMAAAGTNGVTNFTVNIGPYDSGFFRAVLDTNSIPLWELADPNNPSSGIFTVTIDSPANGALLQ